jgi:hypothetical protein
VHRRVSTRRSPVRLFVETEKRMTTATLIAIIIALVGLDVVAGVVVLSALVWRERRRERAQREAFDYDEYRKAHEVAK